MSEQAEREPFTVTQNNTRLLSGTVSALSLVPERTKDLEERT